MEILIPPIFVIEDENGVWDVVDGVQRLLIFFSFEGRFDNENNLVEPKNNWKLEECAVIKSIKGLSYDNLSIKNQLKLNRTFCTVNVIQTDEKDYDSRYQIFKRLNNWGRKLTDEEIRSIIYK